MSAFAVITGGARGLGAAMAERLLVEGFSVEAWDLKAESEISHPKFSIRAVNVADAKAVKAAAAECLAKNGIPTVLVNNAGITRDALIHKMSPEDFELTWKINVEGTFLVTQALGSAMREEASAKIKKGEAPAFRRIIGISSIAGINGNVGQANYASSKAGVVAMMKSIGKEWGRYGISTVAIAPGMMNTEMIRTVPKEIQEDFRKRTPLQRFGEAKELAGLVAYLAREESAYLTCDLITFSGGLLL